MIILLIDQYNSFLTHRKFQSMFFPRSWGNYINWNSRFLSFTLSGSTSDLTAEIRCDFTSWLRTFLPWVTCKVLVGAKHRWKIKTTSKWFYHSAVISDAIIESNKSSSQVSLFLSTWKMMCCFKVHMIQTIADWCTLAIVCINPWEH